MCVHVCISVCMCAHTCTFTCKHVHIHIARICVHTDTDMYVSICTHGYFILLLNPATPTRELGRLQAIKTPYSQIAVVVTKPHTCQNPQTSTLEGVNFTVCKSYFYKSDLYRQAVSSWSSHPMGQDQAGKKGWGSGASRAFG